MKSLDANILVYAFNEDAVEHPKAKAFLDTVLENPNEWILSDQTLFEFYGIIRHPRILDNPLNAMEATARLEFLRDESGIFHCSYDTDCWGGTVLRLREKKFPYKRTFDAVLAVALIENGVDTFYTRNLKDFRGMGFKNLINPIDEH